MLILTIIVNPYPKYVGWIYEFFLANIPIKSYILVLLQAFPLLLQMIQIQALLLVEASSPPPSLSLSHFTFSSLYVSFCLLGWYKMAQGCTEPYHLLTSLGFGTSMANLEMNYISKFCNMDHVMEI